VKKNFMVTAHGWSASNWLAYVLNQHDEIICSHSAMNIVDHKFENSIKNNLKEFHNGYLNRQNRPIDESYEYIESHGEAKYYGSVHLYRLRDLPVQYEKFGSSKRIFTVMNLIRNPIDLVWSGYGQFKELFRTDLNELYWTVGKVLEDKEFIYHLNDKYDLHVGDYENLAFIGAARVLGSLRLDLDAMEKIKEIPFIRYLGEIKMEEVTTNPETLKHLIHSLSDNEINVTKEYLENIYQIGHINKHKKDNKSMDAKQRYESLEEWQKETLMYYMKKYDIIGAYQMYGYHFDYLEAVNG